MPFVTKEHRQYPDLTIPGDTCYILYNDIMKRWKECPRWTTIDAILTDLFPDQFQRAFFLAFLVFFNIHGMPYEEKKRAENGDIDGISDGLTVTIE